MFHKRFSYLENLSFRSINLISASPSDRGLLDALSQGVLLADCNTFWMANRAG